VYATIHYLLLATISALYYALLYLLITCSLHLYKVGAKKMMTIMMMMTLLSCMYSK